MEYVLGVGTNIGDRAANIAAARDALNLLPSTKVTAQSDIYETAPVGYADQQNFYNAAFKVTSVLEPDEMLGACLGIEAALGRKRLFKNGPRIIDIDVIFAENTSINSKNLTLPHPRWRERRFVLLPLNDLFENGVVYGTDIAPLLKNTENQAAVKIEF